MCSSIFFLSVHKEAKRISWGGGDLHPKLHAVTRGHCPNIYYNKIVKSETIGRRRRQFVAELLVSGQGNSRSNYCYGREKEKSVVFVLEFK